MHIQNDGAVPITKVINLKHIVLMGDSIFDNRAYVGKNSEVIQHLKGMLPSTWQATLVAVDGYTSRMALAQVASIPESATHLILSVGGNDALQSVHQLLTPARTVMDGLTTLNQLQSEFHASYRLLVQKLLELNKPLVACTIYDAIPQLPQEHVCALSLYNDVILREAIRHGLQVLDLRMVCTGPQHFSDVSPIEPSSLGGRKIAERIVDFIENHEFNDQSFHGFMT